MRITGGIFGGRHLSAPKGMQTRPTTDRTRGAVFNILCHSSWGDPEGKTVLDGFCGTGALGLEALSRGAVSAVFIDKTEAALAACRHNIEQLNLSGIAQVVKSDLSKPVKKPLGPFELVFLDPPYGMGLGAQAMQNLFDGGCLGQNAVIVLESGKKQPEKIPDTFEAIDRRDYGDTSVSFLKIKSLC